uniref:Uncharacterized protein n=1 Tax=Palpitomonas bilix TaxID=652834 RepID=A0A7S3LVX6_9EUKA
MEVEEVGGQRKEGSSIWSSEGGHKKGSEHAMSVSAATLPFDENGGMSANRGGIVTVLRSFQHVFPLNLRSAHSVFSLPFSPVVVRPDHTRTLERGDDPSLSAFELGDLFEETSPPSPSSSIGFEDGGGTLGERVKVLVRGPKREREREDRDRERDGEVALPMEEGAGVCVPISSISREVWAVGGFRPCSYAKHIRYIVLCPKVGNGPEVREIALAMSQLKSMYESLQLGTCREMDEHYIMTMPLPSMMSEEKNKSDSVQVAMNIQSKIERYATEQEKLHDGKSKKDVVSFVIFFMPCLETQEGFSTTFINDVTCSLFNNCPLSFRKYASLHCLPSDIGRLFDEKVLFQLCLNVYSLSRRRSRPDTRALLSTLSRDVSIVRAGGKTHWDPPFRPFLPSTISESLYLFVRKSPTGSWVIASLLDDQSYSKDTFAAFDATGSTSDSISERAIQVISSDVLTRWRQFDRLMNIVVVRVGSTAVEERELCHWRGHLGHHIFTQKSGGSTSSIHLSPRVHFVTLAAVPVIFSVLSSSSSSSIITPSTISTAGSGTTMLEKGSTLSTTSAESTFTPISSQHRAGGGRARVRRPPLRTIRRVDHRQEWADSIGSERVTMWGHTSAILNLYAFAYNEGERDTHTHTHTQTQYGQSEGGGGGGMRSRGTSGADEGVTVKVTPHLAVKKPAGAASPSRSSTPTYQLHGGGAGGGGAPGSASSIPPTSVRALPAPSPVPSPSTTASSVGSVGMGMGVHGSRHLAMPSHPSPVPPRPRSNGSGEEGGEGGGSTGVVVANRGPTPPMGVVGIASTQAGKESGGGSAMVASRGGREEHRPSTSGGMEGVHAGSNKGGGGGGSNSSSSGSGVGESRSGEEVKQQPSSSTSSRTRPSPSHSHRDKAKKRAATLSHIRQDLERFSVMQALFDGAKSHSAWNLGFPSEGLLRAGCALDALAALPPKKAI